MQHKSWVVPNPQMETSDGGLNPHFCQRIACTLVGLDIKMTLGIQMILEVGVNMKVPGACMGCHGMDMSPTKMRKCDVDLF